MTIQMFPPRQALLLPRRLLRLDAPGPEASNEEQENVRVIADEVTHGERSVHFQLPAWSSVVLLAPGES